MQHKEAPSQSTNFRSNEAQRNENERFLMEDKRVQTHNNAFRRGLEAREEAARLSSMDREARYLDTSGGQRTVSRGDGKKTPEQPVTPVFQSMDRQVQLHSELALTYAAGDPDMVPTRVGLLLHPLAGRGGEFDEQLRVLKEASSRIPSYGERWNNLDPKVRDEAENRILQYELDFKNNQAAVEAAAKGVVDKDKGLEKKFKALEEKNKQQPRKNMGGKASV